jgi:hypothetical protein
MDVVLLRADTEITLWRGIRLSRRGFFASLKPAAVFHRSDDSHFQGALEECFCRSFQSLHINEKTVEISLPGFSL